MQWTYNSHFEFRNLLSSFQISSIHRESLFVENSTTKLFYSGTSIVSKTKRKSERCDRLL